MTSRLPRSIHLFAVTLLLCIAAPPVDAQNGELSAPRIPLIESPVTDAQSFIPVRPSSTRPDPSWIIRTGIKKGIIGMTTAPEQQAGPDAAVLKAGFFEPWPDLLAEFAEPAVFVDAKRIAGLARTKPYLIIPSGALHGLSRSSFVRAGLAAYVRSGGTILCFAQPDGADFAALPVPEGSAIAAAGWRQDPGPFFRASSVQTRHPMLAGTIRTVPEIETSGYFTQYPAASRVVLARTDGYPTLIEYPYGEGRVVATVLFPDHAYDEGTLSSDERALVRDMLRWAKAPAQDIDASPGQQLSFQLALQGPEEGDAASVRLFVRGPGADQTASEMIISTPVRQGQPHSLSFQYAVPADIRSGIYQIEYEMLDNAGRKLSARAESLSGRFSIGQPAAAAPVPRLPRPHAGLPIPLNLQPSLERTGNTLRLKFLVTRIPDIPWDLEPSFFVRAGGQEQTVDLGGSPHSLVYTLSEPSGVAAIPYVLYHKSGRSLIRGAVPVMKAAEGDVNFGSSPLSGTKTAISFPALGKGELMVMGPGLHKKQMVTGNVSIVYAVPADLPAGTYRMKWKHTPMKGAARQGDAQIAVAGYRVKIVDTGLDSKVSRGSVAVTALLKVHSTRKIAGHIRLRLLGPDGTSVPATEGPVQLVAGLQELPFSFTVQTGSGGIWELQSTIEARLPEGPGLIRTPVVIAADSTFFDIGPFALLDLATARPVYYEPAQQIGLIAYLAGTGRAGLELLLDTRRVSKEKIDLSGLSVYEIALPDPGAGMHTLKAVVSGGDLESSGEHQFITGARLPDLAVEVRAPEPAGPVLAVSIVVRNAGKLASSPTAIALYEGDPSAGGLLINRTTVPELDPGKEYAAAIDWPLLKKAGTRTLVAVVDPDKAVPEPDENNNRAAVEVKIPDLLLNAPVQKRAYRTNEFIAVTLGLFNLSLRSYTAQDLKLGLFDASGRAVYSETVPFPEFPAGAQKTLVPSIPLESLPVGKYQFKAQFGAAAPLVVTATDIDILPTMLVRGSLEGTPKIAAFCLPFTIHYRARNAGNLPVSSGEAEIRVVSTGTGQTAVSRKLPLVLDARSWEIKRVDFPAGDYIITLKGSAPDQEKRTSREFALAEQPLQVAPPISVRKGTGVLPRVLVWLGRTGAAVQQALVEQIAHQAFDEQSIYVKTVDSGDDFVRETMTGLYNTYILFEVDDLSGRSAWLREKVSSGHGLVIVGTGDQTRELAEAFGYTFSEANPSSGQMLSFHADEGTGLSGTLPVSGRMLVPKKKGAQAAAVYAGDLTAAALIDTAGKGKVMVMPFSLSRSALDSGAPSLYGLLLRTALLRTAPEKNDDAAVGLEELMVSSLGDRIKARIIVTVPAGASALWANTGGVIRQNTISYELTAEQDAQRLLYLYRRPSGAAASAGADIYYECDGSFVRQGRVE